MPYTHPLPVERAVFIERPNRFIVMVNYQSKELRCHLPNPGRMNELLRPGIIVLITFHSNPVRKTRASVVGVEVENEIIQLQSNLVAKWLPADFASNNVPGLEGWKVIHQEYSIGPHRFDFVLKDPTGREVITEIKSTTRVKNGTACFPDGVSARATRHLQKLIELAHEGKKVMILFVVQRQAHRFWPCTEVDPLFAKSFEVSLTVDNLQIRVPMAISTLIRKNGKSYIKTEFVSQLPIENAT